MGIQEEFSKRNAQEETDFIIVERRLLNEMKSVMERMYAPESLGGDERRDIANRLHAILNNIIVEPYEES